MDPGTVDQGDSCRGHRKILCLPVRTLRLAHVDNKYSWVMITEQNYPNDWVLRFDIIW